MFCNKEVNWFLRDRIKFREIRVHYNLLSIGTLCYSSSCKLLQFPPLPSKQKKNSQTDEQIKHKTFRLSSSISRLIGFGSYFCWNCNWSKTRHDCSRKKAMSWYDSTRRDAFLALSRLVSIFKWFASHLQHSTPAPQSLRYAANRFELPPKKVLTNTLRLGLSSACG